ncbi:hypothetical protein EG329_012429 [Mollisiaceae sp. DMI_Dod_QoI]|nr:hypothetical protein EG329_012429 [Helotiales sp. DMI_Dod_QoI]
MPGIYAIMISIFTKCLKLQKPARVQTHRDCLPSSANGHKPGVDDRRPLLQEQRKYSQVKTQKQAQKTAGDKRTPLLQERTYSQQKKEKQPQKHKEVVKESREPTTDPLVKAGVIWNGNLQGEDWADNLLMYFVFDDDC